MAHDTELVHHPVVRTICFSRDHEENIVVFTLKGGRILKVPIGDFPELSRAPDRVRENWRLIGGGRGVHWPDIDLDLSVDGLLRDY